MKNPNSLLFPLAVLPALLCSCAKEIVMDAREEPVVAVECILSEQPIQTLRLSFTKGAAMDEAPTLTEADAVLIDLTEGKTVGSFKRQDDGTWALDYAAVPEHSYRLEVDVPGYETVWAEQTMPTACLVISTFMNIFSSSTHVLSLYGSCFFFNFTTEIAWIRALNYNPDTGTREYAEYICTDAPNVSDFNLAGATYDPPVSDTDVWGHKRTAYLYPNLRGAPLHRRYLRIELPLKFDSGGESAHAIHIAGSMTGKYYHKDNPFSQQPIDRPPRSDEGIVVVSYVSRDYDRYLREAIYYKKISESTDLADMLLRENIFTNIHGGLGIFGAKTETVVEWVPAYTNNTE